MVKEELTSEEKFFEKAVVTEKFVKKYKNLMIGGVVAIVLVVAGDIIYTANKQSTIENANAAVAQLQKNPNNQAQLTKLKSLSPALHDLWIYSQAVSNNDRAALMKLKDSKAPFIADLASYEIAQDSKSLSKLEQYTERQDAIYADLARIQSAIILMNEKKIKESHELLSMININSPLSQVAKSLMHYGVK